jgi:hypothetical protein
MGATLSSGRLASHPATPIERPHGSAEMVEHDHIRQVSVRERPAPDGVAFLDGIQRYSHEANLGLVPVLRAYVAAMVQLRAAGQLGVWGKIEKHFLVAPLARLKRAQREALARLGLAVHESRAQELVHPLVDRQRAIEEIERQREATEQLASERFLAAHPEQMLIVDGAIGDSRAGRNIVGVVKSHETQYLEGSNLEAALTLPSGTRSSVFARRAANGKSLHTWYLRLWPWEGEDLFYGLVRVERNADHDSAAVADELSGWLMSERTPLSCPDERWDRLLYPIHAVEERLRAQAGSWA